MVSGVGEGEGGEAAGSWMTRKERRRAVFSAGRSYHDLNMLFLGRLRGKGEGSDGGGNAHCSVSSSGFGSCCCRVIHA